MLAVALVAGCAPGAGTVEIHDAGVKFDHPAGWSDKSVSDVRSMLEQQLSTTTGEVHQAFQTAIDDIDRGVVQAVLLSVPTADGFTESVLVQVEDRSEDLAAAAARRLDYVTKLTQPVATSITDAELPFGPAKVVEASTTPRGGSLSHSIEYVVLLADGRTLTLLGTGPSTDEAFDDTMRTIAVSLKAT